MREIRITETIPAPDDTTQPLSLTDWARAVEVAGLPRSLGPWMIVPPGMEEAVREILGLVVDESGDDAEDDA